MSNSSSIPGAPRKPLARRLLRLLLALAIGLSGALLIAEGCVRFLLFSDAELAVSEGKQFRSPSRLTAGIREQEFWRLRHLWESKKKRTAVTRPDALVGWRSPLIQGPGFEHRDEKRLAGRRPFLMYGDSFTACMVKVEDCWGGLLSKSPLNEELAVINYGVKGHGLGQIYLVLKHSIDAWVDQGPVVSIGILIDDDMDRAPLGLRGGVKPSFGIEDGELAIELPQSLDVDEWLDGYSPPARSYLWSLLLYGTEVIPRSWHAPRLESLTAIQFKQDLAVLLVDKIQQKLEDRGLDYFFILFEGPQAMARGKSNGWRRKFLTRLLNERGIPWVDARKAVEFDLQARDGVHTKDYFMPPRSPKSGHYNAKGNAVVWTSIYKALHGIFDGALKQLPRDPTQRRYAQ